MYSKPFFAAMMLMFFSGSAFSELAITSDISTDSIDLFAQSKGQTKSTNLALGASLLLPGAGHQYLNRNRSALAYFSVDACALFGFFFCANYAFRVANDAAGYAWLHSGASGSIKTADDNYWKIVGNYMDTEEYNRIADLNRAPDKRFIDPNLVWHWDDKSSQDTFNRLRSRSRVFGVASSFCIGAMIVNRIVAFIDIRATTRRTGVYSSGTASRGTAYRAPTLSFDIAPLVNVSPTHVQLQLVTSF